MSPVPGYFKHEIKIAKWKFDSIVIAGFLAGFAFGSWAMLEGAPRIFADESAAGHYTWTFDNSGDYSLSSSTLAEVASNKFRLKVRNYVTDANTKWLGHFDEANGTTVTDSAAGNNGTLNLPNPTPTTTWTAGKFDGSLNGAGALNLNGTSSYVSVPNSSDVALTQANTLEAWIKFNKTFNSTSHGNVQSIINKGDYKLFLNNETNKVIYELTPNTTPSWAQLAGNELNGSWDLDGKSEVSAVTKANGRIYAGTGTWNGTTAGDGEVFEWDGTAWTWIGGNGKKSSWADGVYDEVTTLKAWGNNVIAGMGNGVGDADVWMYNGTSWSKIGGDSGGTSAGYSWDTGYDRVESMEVNGDKVYVGLGTSATEAELWACDLSVGCTPTSGWTKIGGDATGTAADKSWLSSGNYERVYSITFVGTRIFVGLGETGSTTPDSEVWTCDTAGTCTTTSGWKQVGGDGLYGSWNTTYEIVSVLTSYTDNSGHSILLAGLGNTAGDAEIWKCDITASTNCSTAGSWSVIVDGNTGSGTVPQSWNYAELITSLVVDDQASNDYLYVGLGQDNGDGEVWKCDLEGTCSNTDGWTKLGGDGVGSPASWSGNYTRIRAMYLDGSTLYAGTISGTAGLGELWRYDTQWTRIGGQYLYGSWGYNTLDSVNTMTTAMGKLYAGTGNSAGDSTVWEYDGAAASPEWTLVGGQATKGSWAYNTFEKVNTMVGARGALYVGLGNSTDDGDVWKWDGSTWTQFGGTDGTTTINGGWADATNIEEVLSMTNDDRYLYAGLGNSDNDADVWRIDLTSGSPTWTQIGGTNGSTTVNSGWSTSDAANGVYSLVRDGKWLYAGLGGGSGEGDVWRLDTTAGTLDWEQIGGLTSGGAVVNSGWGAADGIEMINSMVAYNGDLYVGMGSSSGDAEVWKFTTASNTWARIAGNGADAGYTSWGGSDYEVIQSLAVYNGQIYAALGNGAQDGEVWVFDGTSWTQIGGDGVRSSWNTTDNIEVVSVLTVYRGKLRAGTGNSSGVDAMIWSYGNNLFLESDAALTNTTDWNHIAATYDGSTAKMYINGTLQTNTASSSISLQKSGLPLLIGTSFGGRGEGEIRGFFDGAIDEVRISDVARASSEMTEATYAQASSPVTIRPATARMASQIDAWSGFSVTEGASGSYRYCLSSDGGTTWKYWNSSAWETSACNTLATGSTESDTNTNIGSFPVTSNGILWKAILSGDGSQAAEISEARIDGTPDTSNPTVPANVALQANNNLGVVIPGGSDNWYSYSQVYVHWSAAKDDSDGTGADVPKYYVYFGPDSSAAPSTAGVETANTYYTKTLTAGTSGTYYIKVQAKDNAGNVSAASTTVIYQYDDADPAVVRSLAVSPEAYATDNEFIFTWLAPLESNIRGYVYKINSGDWSSETTALTVTLSGQAADGENTFYIAAVDKAGNQGTTSSIKFYLAGAGPSVPQNLAVDSTPKTENLFTFSWDAPATYLGGDPTKVKYCYTINEEPSADTCTNSNTLTGTRTLGPGAYATQKTNTLYVIAKNPDSYGGSVNYAGKAWATITFVADTTAPGIPTNVEISDISIKNTSTWRLTVSWAAPATGADSVYNYKAYQSTDNNIFTEIGSTTGTAYVITGLSQVPYYYQVRACDKAGSCSAYTTAVTETPTGKYTAAAGLASGPASSSITTKKATITWSTDRSSDSKIQYGTSSNSYLSEEPSNSTQVTSHSISLTNLSAGTTYYYRAKWTDEDGNTGTSDEKSFSTESAPTAKDVVVKSVGLDSALIQFTTKGAAKAKVFYGMTTGFGFVKEVSTGANESTYAVTLDKLDDGTKYYYKIDVYDSEDAAYTGTILNFTTLPRPKITTVRIQEVTGSAQPTVIVVWDTNTEISSIVTYYPQSDPGSAKDEVNVALKSGQHKMVLRGLMAQKDYSLIVKGRDKAGNEAVSDVQRFTTSTDTRPPQIIDLGVEGSNIATSGNNGEQSSQFVVTWNTDEPATSQVEFGEGTGTTYSQKTQEDANLTSNHLVVISGLVPSRVYHLRAISKDKPGNVGNSTDTVNITPKATDSAFNLVVSNLSEVFGFVGSLAK